MELRIKNVVIYDRRKYKWRKPMSAIPHNRFWFFNEDQYNTYVKLKESGWKLYFIRRRPRIRKHAIALINNDGTSIGVLEDNGDFALDPLPIKLRHSGVPQPTGRT